MTQGSHLILMEPKQFTTKFFMQIAILAGGLATRLRPLTKKVPKALIKINGVPFIDYQIKYLKKQGITNIVLCTGFLGDQILDYVGDGARYGLKIIYSNDGERLLGTGGAIKNALTFLDDNFFVMYGDSFLPIDYLSVYSKFKQKNLLALMTILENKNKWDRSNVIFDGNKIILYDKKNYTSQMNYIDYGLSILNRELFTEILDNSFDLAEIFSLLSKKQELDYFEVENRFYEIGSKQGIEDFSKFVLNNNLTRS